MTAHVIISTAVMLMVGTSIPSTNAWLSCPPSKNLNVPGVVGKPVLLNAGTVQLDGSIATDPNAGRSYLGNKCDLNSATPWKDTKNIMLLGRKLAYTIDLSTIGCNCNAAIYLVSMGQNRLSNMPPKMAHECRGDNYYCDANKVCGTPCAEIDIMEANNHAFVSTLHKSTGMRPETSAILFQKE